MITSDVVVVGGGPSGLHVASRLAERGISVQLLEKKTEIGKNVTCTGIVGKDVFGRFGVGTDSILREIDTTKLVSPFGTSLVYKHPAPFACVVDRDRFDKQLAAEARTRGVAISLGCRVEDFSLKSDGIEVKAAAQDGRGPLVCRARMAVFATGVDYNLHAKTGLDCPSDFLHGAQIELNTEQDGHTTIFVGKNIAPGAFAWAVPAGPKRIRVGLLARKAPRHYLRRLLERHNGDQWDCPDDCRIRLKPVAQGLMNKTAGDRVIALGEAAGQVKTTTGGGIYFGLLCSEIAAETIETGMKQESFSAAVLSRYESRWKAALKKEILLGYYARKICASLSDRQVERIFHIAQNDGIIPIVRSTANFDWHADLIVAIFKRLSFFKVFKGSRDISDMKKLP